MSERIVVTTKEALQLLGVRAQSLKLLERMTGLSPRSKRKGFTSAEIHHLFGALQQAVVGRK